MIEKVKGAIDNFLNPSATFFDAEYTKRKAAEECCELATALMQNINKKGAMNDQQIEDEIADVLMWVNELVNYYDSTYINARIEKKKTNYFKNGKLHHNYL
jgi:NTP pyrophosphatase (non-canonical NTP hydrolase)